MEIFKKRKSPETNDTMLKTPCLGCIFKSGYTDTHVICGYAKSQGTKNPLIDNNSKMTQDGYELVKIKTFQKHKICAAQRYT